MQSRRQKKDKPQGTQSEKHTRITKKIKTFVSFVKTFVSLVVKIFFVSLPDRFLTLGFTESKRIRSESEVRND